MVKTTVLFGGELAGEIAEKIVEGAKERGIEAEAVNMTNFKKVQLGEIPQVVVFVVQTVENDEPPESAGSCIRLIKRKTNEPTMFASLSYAVLAVGDSNLLLDRQTTTAKDCNKVGQALDARLAELGATRICEVGLADERTGLREVEPFLETLYPALLKASFA